MAGSDTSGFDLFLEKLGFLPLGQQAGRYVHTIEIAHNQKAQVEFLYIPTSSEFPTEVTREHRRIWNSNNSEAFVVVSDDKSHVFSSKIKPNEQNPWWGKIETFESGVKTEIDPQILESLSCSRVNAGYFFDFVREKSRRNQEQEVDKDLLLNLIALRRDLTLSEQSQPVADLLILRCLFLKYLEDRGIYQKGYVSGILNSGNPYPLLQAFDAVGRINGDIFKNEPLAKGDISPTHLNQLYRFFNSDYRTGQGTLFPYQFQHIPIQLISHVYEAFLSSAKRQGKGIYYTPQFIVNFILEETLVPTLRDNQDVSVLDPACGSGAFLVESFQKIVRAKKASTDFEAKKAILVKQIFGLDNDAQALRIATFSLYLALLEDLDAGFIRLQIDNHAPILPSLIGYNLLHGNTLTDDRIFQNQTFDCIVANPPWGSVPDDTDAEHRQERAAIGGKGVSGQNPDYRDVSDFQRSQAFLLRVSKWATPATMLGLIVNNSVFLNENAQPFRHTFLEKNTLLRFYELSRLNKILFRKKRIGEVQGEPVETGASEPAAFLVFRASLPDDNLVRYVAPRLTLLSEQLNLVHFTQREVKTVQQKTLVTDDMLWKVLVNGSWDDYQLIKQKILEHDPQLIIECRSGFMPQKDMSPTGPPLLRPLIEPSDFDAYFVKSKLRRFNWNQTLLRERDPNLFRGNRMVMAVRPTGKDQYRLRCARISGDEVFQDQILCIKIKKNGHYLMDYAPYLGIFNSSFTGYFTYLTSTQWGKGDMKRSKLRNGELEQIPIPPLTENDPRVSALVVAVAEMERRKRDPFDIHLESLQVQIDQLVFEIYGLLEFEKAIIGEFYDLNVHRKDALVTDHDLMIYTEKFKSVFELVLAEHLTLCCEYKISRQFGAFVCFSIQERNALATEISPSSMSDEMIFDAIKQAQLIEAYGSNRLNELPTRVYTSERFFLIKSHFFRDWTVRQAIEDANEEVKTLMQEATVG